MFRDLIAFILVVSGCVILMKGIGGGLLGMVLIFASGIVILIVPRGKNHGEYYDSWYDI